MLVKELLLTKPIVCQIDDYLQKPARIMAENDLTCIPVVESLAHNNLIGVISEKDICRRAIADGLDPSKTTVGRVMNSRYLTVDSETEIKVCFRKFKESKTNYLFVVDENNSCIGVLTEEELFDTDTQFHNHDHKIHNLRNDRIF